MAGARPPGRLLSGLSTLDDVHGSKERNTEVPREKLVNALRKDSTFIDTRATAPGQLSTLVEIPLT